MRLAIRGPVRGRLTSSRIFASLLRSSRLRALLDPLAIQRRGLSWFGLALTYLVLIDVAFVFLFPVFYMISTSLKSAQDLADATVYWIPRSPAWENYLLGFRALDFLPALRNSLASTVPAAFGQVLSCSFIAYGLARMRFPGREPLFLLVLFTFLIPPQTIIIPLFILYRHLGWIDTFYPFIVPSFLGHGLQGALFILVFRQFFRGLPSELEDAASIDGANPFRTFFQIMLPLARPAILVVLLFSLVWHWNDYFEPMMFFYRTVSARRPESPIAIEPIVRPTLSGSLSKTAAMLIPCSAKIGELAIACPSRPAPTSAMLCCPWVRRIFRISPSSESML